MENENLKISGEVQRYKKIYGLMHYVNQENLINQHKKQLTGKATGIDKVTKAEYSENLKDNIGNLLKRMKTFSYRPQAVRRVYIPKTGSDKLRPLGIPSYEDKLVQGAMAELLTAVYEPKFKDCSYGFRPERSCHKAVGIINIINRFKKHKN